MPLRRIVQLLPHSFLPPEDGGRLKSATLASALAKLGELHLLSFEDDHLGASAKEAPQEMELPFGGRAWWHSLRHASNRERFPRSLLLRLRPDRAPFGWRPRTPRGAALMGLLADLAPDTVVADDTRQAPWAVFSGARLKVVHTHNLESRLWRNFAEAKPGDRGLARDAALYARLEREILPLADQVWGVREEDLEVYRSLGCRGLGLMPNVIPAEHFLSNPTPGEPGVGLYFSSLWYAPNAEAAREMVGLATRLRAAGHAVHLQVAGRGASPELEALMARTEGLEALGFVKDLEALKRRAAAVIIPLNAGGGTKLKTLEAMAAGKPLLTTPTGAEGIGLVDGVHAFIRDLGPAFDVAAAELLARPEAHQAMGLAAQALARERFSQTGLEARVAAALAI
jgi:glycosyltransferase involved in cell wall biosynthesis